MVEPTRAAQPRLLTMPGSGHDLLRRLYAARAKVARLVVFDPVYAPVFERLEREIAARENTDVLARARAIVQNDAA